MSQPTGDETRRRLEKGKKCLQGKRDQDRRFRELVNSLKSSLSDSDLRDILSRPPEERDEYGQINNPDLIFQFVARKHQGHAVEHDEAKEILDHAVDYAIRLRLLDTNGFSRITYRCQQNGWKCVVSHWRTQEFILPEVFQNIPMIVVEEDSREPSDGFRFEG
ncbi:hypothetical protein UA08_01297 [Talaromyces atroroseus]|uniref:Uncharacterized protein n=1 Tax=Talaromyces atroroseus TaxID=1441469 RepID=A0A1Q5QAB8_TALAT|nr:hypothetical protein UA08_01297 [Talaromyces atroroseus]OKL62875.1 hypothetical protein UA08_01297 [Talaromyces atroroseus]